MACHLKRRNDVGGTEQGVGWPSLGSVNFVGSVNVWDLCLCVPSRENKKRKEFNSYVSRRDVMFRNGG